MNETFEPVGSSHIARVEFETGFNPGMGTMKVVFTDGSVYDHFNVPQDKFLGIQNAASAGSYYNRQIKGRHDYAQA